MILRTVNESSTIITSGGPDAAALAAAALAACIVLTTIGAWASVSVRCASCTGLMIKTTSPVPSTVAPAMPETRASCGPMFLTTTS